MLKSRIPQITVELQVRLEHVVDEGTDVVERDAKAAVPVATGKLRAAIHKERRSDGTYVVGGDDDAWYGHLIEYGTTRTAPRPFMVPALEMNRAPIIAQARSALRGL
jgi:HK97 gp10 family phage protein